MTPKILAFAGSLRHGSYNNMLVKIAEQGAIEAGGEVTHLNLRDLPLPLFDEDLEADAFPENATAWKELFKSHDGLLIACPEYNSSMTGCFKNLIDWVSRPVPGEYDFEPFDQKIASIMCASPGGLGGLRAISQYRALLGHIQMIVLPQQLGIIRAGQAFDENGALKDEKLAATAKKLGANVVEMVRKVKA